jgi:hypothetical protein
MAVLEVTKRVIHLVKNILIWDVAPYCSVEVHRHFGGT